MRTALILVLAGMVVGCGEEERPRFVPADPSQAATRRPAPSDSGLDAKPPRNIATH
ncbi:hypothetical protein TA3x_003112 [Tundrisphaera sp. TA3]|uniref:hypothetical protein n=1 Tax=Tundrisphaera sp. TA3 TaxID=3435775 RepID=UPI003EBA2D5A